MLQERLQRMDKRDDLIRQLLEEGERRTAVEEEAARVRRESYEKAEELLAHVDSSIAKSDGKEPDSMVKGLQEKMERRKAVEKEATQIIREGCEKADKLLDSLDDGIVRNLLEELDKLKTEKTDRIQPIKRPRGKR